jgi:hypothetical protein
VNKTHGINTTFRTFAMEVIAGQEDLDTEVVHTAHTHTTHTALSFRPSALRWALQSESRCRFAFNYGQVYWNSRLQAEHERLLKKLKPADIVCARPLLPSHTMLLSLSLSGPWNAHMITHEQIWRRRRRVAMAGR